MNRRLFLERFARSAGCFVVTASIGGIGACSRENPVSLRSGTSPVYSFPQGVASADPQSDAVILWTRIVSTTSGAPIEFTVQIAEDEDFSEVVAQQSLEASAGLDHTVRCFADGLEPGRWYFYRFVTPDGYASRTGRTRTAPPDDEPARLNLALFSCQDYENGFFNAYRRLIADDAEREESDRIDVCLHVGDFIYENVNKPFETMDGEPIELRNPDGSGRRITALPSGGRQDRRGVLIPVTAEDYRHVYRSYLTDDSLLEARARYPFVCIWDDHEVINDYWQAHGPNGAMQQQKVAANQAWFEYVPAALTLANPGPAGFNPAKDFEPADVENVDAQALDDHYLDTEENNLAAIDTLTIYRSLRWGSEIDLLLIDGRSYRGERGVDDTLLSTRGVAAYPAAPLNPDLVRTLNAGRMANGGNAPTDVDVRGEARANPRRQSPYGSLLGETQKRWLEQSLESSTAAWKIIVNNVPMLRFGFDNAFQSGGHKAGLYYTDSWDGYPIERSEIMNFIADGGIGNVVSLSGDRHANFAGLVYDDYDAANPTAVVPEIVGTSVSAGCRFKLMHGLMAQDPELDRLHRCDGGPVNYFYDEAPLLNAWMLFGSESARVYSASYNEAEALAARDRRVNPHMQYADNDAYGYVRIAIEGRLIDVEFVVMPEPAIDESAITPSVRRRVHTSISAWAAGQEPVFGEFRVDGEPPFFGLKS